MSPAQKVQVLLPGRPDAPILFTRAINSDEFVVEWAEPKLYAVKVKGYQVGISSKVSTTPTIITTAFLIFSIN